MNNLDFFLQPVSVPQKQYEALRMYYVENKKAKEVAKKFGYTYRAFTSIVSDFNNALDAMDYKIAENTIYLLLKKEGFARLPKRIKQEKWKRIRVEQSGNKKRTIKVYEQTLYLKGYGKSIRQIYVTGNGKIKPAIIITNDFDKNTNEIVT